MIVKLLGGRKDGHEVNMGPGWPGPGVNPPPVFWIMETPPPASISLREIPDSELQGAVQFRLVKWNEHVAVYRHPDCKL